MIAAGASADPFGWKALRGAMGSAFRLPVVRVPDADEALPRVPARGCRVVATALDGTPLDAVALDEPCAILLGAEGTGLPPALVEAADVRLTIPMQPPVESLNVAVAAGIILYEARRQRTAQRSRRTGTWYEGLGTGSRRHGDVSLARRVRRYGASRGTGDSYRRQSHRNAST